MTSTRSIDHRAVLDTYVDLFECWGLTLCELTIFIDGNAHLDHGVEGVVAVVVRSAASSAVVVRALAVVRVQLDVGLDHLVDALLGCINVLLATHQLDRLAVIALIGHNNIDTFMKNKV